MIPKTGGKLLVQFYHTGLVWIFICISFGYVLPSAHVNKAVQSLFHVSKSYFQNILNSPTIVNFKMINFFIETNDFWSKL